MEIIRRYTKAFANRGPILDPSLFPDPGSPGCGSRVSLARTAGSQEGGAPQPRVRREKQPLP